jgi:DNA-binding response OmpR family regulator
MAALRSHRQADPTSDHPVDPIQVILVEDDRDLRQGIAEYLRFNAMQVTDVASGVGFYKAFRKSAFDVAILDVNLPDTNGYDLARDLSAEQTLGVIMLTARSGRTDKLQGYAAGADLYLAKPVDGEELVLAIRNLARRVRQAEGSPRTSSGMASSGADGGWRLDLRHYRLLAPGNVSIDLTGREVMILEQLAKAKGGTIPRRVLAEALGYGAHGAENRGLDVALSRLRQKTNAQGVELPLHAVHSVGVRFTVALEVE